MLRQAESSRGEVRSGAALPFPRPLAAGLATFPLITSGSPTWLDPDEPLRSGHPRGYMRRRFVARQRRTNPSGVRGLETKGARRLRSQLRQWLPGDRGIWTPPTGDPSRGTAGPGSSQRRPLSCDPMRISGSTQCAISTDSMRPLGSGGRRLGLPGLNEEIPTGSEACPTARAAGDLPPLRFSAVAEVNLLIAARGDSGGWANRHWEFE